MSPPSTLSSRPASSRGFTLLEMLVVIVVLAALGGAAVVAAGDRRDDALRQVAQMEMQKIKQALLQFRRDTGYLPGQGPFALVNLDTTDNLDGSCTFASSSVGGVRRLSVPSDFWFASPANFSQLYVAPAMCTNHPQAALVQPWQPATGRGWRGPYLSAQGEGLVDAGDTLQGNGSGSPVSGSPLPNLPGVADPFVMLPVKNNSDTACEDSDPDSACLLDWRSASGESRHARWGRPYLMFDLGIPARARLVSMGPDGHYDGVNGSNPCAPPPDTDDLVLCLLR